MTLAPPTLLPWSGPPPAASRFEGSAPVFWLGEGAAEGWLAGLRQELSSAGRLFAPTLATVPVPRPAGNPWAHVPDQDPPLRWGEAASDARKLDELEGCPEQFAGLVLDGIVATLNEQEARNALRQASDRLPSDAPFVLVERNGSYLPHVLRSLQSGHGKQKEGGGLWRSAQELRRHLELSGLGLEEVRGLAQGARLGPLGGMVARRLPGPGAPWLVVVGRKV